MRRRLLVGLLITLGAACAPIAAAGADDSRALRFDLEFVEPARRGVEPESAHARLWISGRRVRIEQERAGRDEPLVALYRGDEDRFYALDARDQGYVQVDREMIVEMGDRVRAARREVEARLHLLPPGQRKMVERLIGARSAGSELPVGHVSAKPTGETRKLAGHLCLMRELKRGEREMGRACVVAWKRVGVDDQELEVLRQLGNFQRELMGVGDLTPLELVPMQPYYIVTELSGLPLLFEQTRKGVVHSELRVNAIERVAVRKGHFEVPPGYVARNLGLPGTGSPTTLPAAPAP